MFEGRCATCHAAGDFTGRYLAPWAGQTTDKLFEIIRATMPQDEPGGLSREQYADLLAFMFSRNGFAAGEREMASAPEALRAIVIDLGFRLCSEAVSAFLARGDACDANPRACACARAAPHRHSCGGRAVSDRRHGAGYVAHSPSVVSGRKGAVSARST